MSRTASSFADSGLPAPGHIGHAVVDGDLQAILSDFEENPSPVRALHAEVEGIRQRSLRLSMWQWTGGVQPAQSTGLFHKSE